MTPVQSLTLAQWLRLATPAIRQELADALHCRLSFLWQLARGDRNPSAAKAAEIETATVALQEKHRFMTPVLRSSSCAACAVCPYALKCGGEAA